MHQDSNIGADVNLQLFARRHGGDYVMRSEKRGGYGHPVPTTISEKKRKKKRKKAGAFYIAFAFLFSILLWPIGMVMLWRRKVRWKGLTKLLASIITLALCVCMCIAALTIQTGNPDITRTQDSVNDFIDHSAENVGAFYQTICDRAVVAVDAAKNLSDAVTRVSLANTITSLDYAVQASNDLRALIDKDDTAETAAPDAEVTEVPAEVTAEPEITPDPDATPVPVWESEEETGTAETEAPAETETPEPAETEEAAETVKVAEVTEATQAPEVTEAPADTAEPTVEPTAVVSVDLQPKAAGEAVVYYNKGGKRYHMTPTCNGMKEAPAGTLEEAVNANYKSCSKCQSPDAAILEAEDVVWTDENQLFHLTDECSNFTGSWTLMTLAEALESDYSPCTTCKAGLYMATRTQGSSTEVEETETPEATETPEPTATATPAPEVITPEFALKPAGDAIVYHSSTGKWYHRSSVCQGMTGADPYKLSECADDYKWCRRCEPPLPEYVNEHCLWQDENGLCHTTDECPNFEGQYTLIPRDEALEQGLTGCEMCGADSYLIPNTTINYISE